MGIAVGLTGRAMIRRRDRLLRSLVGLVLRARSFTDLYRSIPAAAVTQFSPHWRRRPGGTRAGAADHGPGPLTREFGSLYVQVVIEEVLHPRAFRRRFVIA